MRRLVAGEPVGGHADQRRVDALVLPALRRQRQPARRGDQQEARVLVAGVDQRIEAAVDERIVDRADRQQPRARSGCAAARPRPASGTGSARRCPARCAGPSAPCPSAGRSPAWRRGTRRCGCAGRTRRAGSPRDPDWSRRSRPGWWSRCAWRARRTSPSPRPISARMSPNAGLRAVFPPRRLRARQRRPAPAPPARSARRPVGVSCSRERRARR